MSDVAQPTDRQPVPGARFADLDLNLIQRHIAVAKERGRYDGPVEPVDYLRLHHGIVDIDGLPVPTVTGILVFASAPERFLSASGIDIAQFTGPTPRSTGLRFMEQVRGPLLGAIDRTVIHAVAVALVKRDAKSLLAHVEEMWNRGVDLRRLAEDLAFHLRHVFVAKATGQAPDELADSDREAVVTLARDSDAAQIARLFDVVHGSVWEIARAPQPKLALEMALLKGLHLAPAASLPDLIARVEKLTGNTPGASGGRPASAPFRA